MPNSGLAEKLEQPSELAYSEPINRIDAWCEARISLVNECGGNDVLHAGAASSGGEFSRINTVTRDDAERFRSLHG